MARVEHLNGQPIAWRKQQAHPTPNKMVRWSKKTTGGHTVKGSLRTICHLDRLNNLAKRKYGVEIEVIQSCYNNTVAASAGTHDFDCCLDLYIPGVNWWEQQRFFRANGFPGWYRHPPLFGNHYHGFSLPPRKGANVSDDFRQEGTKVGEYVDGGYSTVGRKIASSQIEDVYNHAFGLSNSHSRNSDRSWWPSNIEHTIFNLHNYINNRVREMDKAVATQRKKR